MAALLIPAATYNAEKAAKETKEAKDKKLMKIDKAWRKATGTVLLVPEERYPGDSPCVYRCTVSSSSS